MNNFLHFVIVILFELPKILTQYDNQISGSQYPTYPGSGSQYPSTYPGSGSQYPPTYPGSGSQYPPTYPGSGSQFPPNNPMPNYPTNPGSMNPQCPKGWKQDGRCQTTGICIDRKEQCFYNSLCCQVDSKQNQQTTKQNPKNGRMETDWCPIYSYKDGSCSGFKFYCIDPSEQCVMGDCCEKNTKNIPTTFQPSTTFPQQQQFSQQQPFPQQQQQQQPYPSSNYPNPGQTNPASMYPQGTSTYPANQYPPAMSGSPYQQPISTFPATGPYSTAPASTYPSYTYPQQQNMYPTAGGYPSSMTAGVDPALLQQACSLGDERACYSRVTADPTTCSNQWMAQSCPSSCGLCSRVGIGGMAYPMAGGGIPAGGFGK